MVYRLGRKLTQNEPQDFENVNSENIRLSPFGYYVGGDEEHDDCCSKSREKGAGCQSVGCIVGERNVGRVVWVLRLRDFGLRYAHGCKWSVRNDNLRVAAV